MPSPLHGLWVAIGFLTRIPVGDVTRNNTIAVRMASAVPWFPLVGLGIGTIGGGLYLVASEFFAPLVAATISVAATLLVTGAFHHDGLADIADAFGGGWDLEQRLTILKDSRLGTYGTAALAVALILEVAAISQLSPEDGFAAIVVGHSLGRAVALAAMILAPAAGQGLGADYMQDLSPLLVCVGIGVGVAAAAVLSPIFPLVTIGAAAVPAIGVVALAIRKIGGINGDVLGAIVVLSSIATLVVAGGS